MRLPAARATLLIMARIILTQTIKGVTHLIEVRDTAEETAIPGPAYEVDGHTFAVKSFTRRAAGLFVELEPDPAHDHLPTTA